MRILIDINPLAAHRTGIGNYIFHLTEALLRLDQRNRYLLYGPDVAADPFPQLQKRLYIRFAFRNRGFLEYLARRGEGPLLPGRPHLYHLPYPAIPFRHRGRLVVTVHDLAFLYFPEFVSNREFMRHLVRSVSEQVRAADHLLADSCSTARDIQRVFGVPAERITVVYPGFDRETFQP
ncbi:MAG: glycosyltransferase, partial [Armatimonadota bacterium]|nr:glycosyltransferase [Armatimonadota bacterium]